MTHAEVEGTASVSPRWLVDPFVTGTPEQFARARETLVRIGFTEREICERAKVRTIYDVPNDGAPTTDFAAPVDMLSAVIRLFIDGAAFPWAIVTSVVERPVIDALQALGLLTSAATDPALCIAPVALYPIQGVYVVSERHGDITAVATATPADIVYSALTPGARQFVRFMPRVPCDDYLDLCSGTGIAALIAAKHFATRVTGIDITERSTRFARFNAALNGLANATMLEGDLYAGVVGQTFDLIAAHPPYVPSLENTMVYRDGGEDGEQITRRIVAGLVDHLRPGGLFFCDCMMTDRKGTPLEQRIRGMLGPLESEFDIVVGQTGEYDLDAHFANAVRDGRVAPEESARLLARFQALEVERFIGTAFLIGRRRGSTKRQSVTRRRVPSAATTGNHLVWYLQWSVLAAQHEGETDWLLDARPRCVDRTEFRSRSVLRGGKWTVTDGALVTDVPFETQAPCPAWFATLLAWCDGIVTARQHLQRLRDVELLPAAVDDADFAALIRKLTEGGFMELDVCPLSTEVPATPGVA